MRDYVREGAVAVDFTMGNGHDTLWLSEAVGENGKVYAFDIQMQARDNTAALLESKGVPQNYTLILDSHDKVKNYVTEGIDVGVFNFGFLPGGDKNITTKRETSLAAVDAAVQLLNDNGALLIAIYPGHEEGRIEGELIEEQLSRLDVFGYTVAKFRLVNASTAPYFFIVEHNPKN